MSQAAIAAAYKQMAASRIKTIAKERPATVDPIRSGLALKRIKKAVKVTSRRAQPVTSPTKIAAIKAAYTAPRPYTVAAVPRAVLAPQVTGGTQPVAMLALSGIASAALAAAGSPTGQALIGGGLQALGLGGLGGLGLTTTVTGQQTVYSAAFVKNGRIYVQTAKGWVAKGYTPDGAKKKYRRRPRRKRWTQRDEKQMQWQAYITSISAGRPGVPPI